ncbi:MAG: hypothetical protein HYR90_04040 [Candidatus Andersenbacteria bacterium]|nr:hypothetical protein [Candidatus Andersenbacteria bacterium]MBI3251260.1 hypothetical protein [Candidatus Andersenbacteria bacterium]
MADNQNQVGDPDDITGIDPNRLMAALSYLAVLVFVPLLSSRQDPFVAYHAKQGLVILAGYILGVIAAAWIPVIGNVIVLILIIISVVGVIQAVQGKRWKIPVITHIANSFNI